MICMTAQKKKEEKKKWNIGSLVHGVMLYGVCSQ